MLYIVCRESGKCSETIKFILETKLGFFDYEIVDPKVHETNRSYSNAFILGDIGKLTINANKTWLGKVPDKNMTPEDKKAIFAQFQEIVSYVRDHTFKKEILSTDIPRFADLEEFLRSFKGQILELKMGDGRLIGIYPDNDKLQGKYSHEYHVSTILNLSKLQDVIGYTKLSVKDL